MAESNQIRGCGLAVSRVDKPRGGPVTSPSPSYRQRSAYLDVGVIVVCLFGALVLLRLVYVAIFR